MRTFLALCFSVGATRRLAEAVEREAVRVLPQLALDDPDRYDGIDEPVLN